MQEITRIVAMAIVMTVLLTYLRSASQTALASQLAIGFMVMLLFLILPSLQQVIRVFADLGKRAQIRSIVTAQPGGSKPKLAVGKKRACL
jgi:predicted metal-binding membrane protein